MAEPAPKAALCQTIRERLRASLGDQVSEDALATIAEALADEHLRLGPEQDRLIDRPVPGTGDKAIYPIHDSDLKLIDESSALAVAVGAVAGSGWLGVLAKLIPLFYRLRRKRARIEGEPALVLLTLKRAPNPGWSVAEVRDHLKSEYGLERSEDRVRILLQELQDVRLADGTRTRFADEQQGRWFTVDV